MSRPPWLPEPLDFHGQYGGDWDSFLNDSYGTFETDFISGEVRYRGKKVILSDRFPELGDGRHGSFWHVVSTGDGKSEESKQPDIGRMQVISWIKSVLENCPDDELIEWEEVRTNDRRRNDTRTLVWCKAHNFVVVLRKLNYVYVLITAHTVDYSSTERKLQAGYDRSLS